MWFGLVGVFSGYGFGFVAALGVFDHCVEICVVSGELRLVYGLVYGLECESILG